MNNASRCSHRARLEPTVFGRRSRRLPLPSLEQLSLVCFWTARSCPYSRSLCSWFATVRLPANQGTRFADRDTGDGLQARYRSPETLAPSQRIRPAPQSGHWRSIYRWRGVRTTSCLTVITKGAPTFRTQLLTISRLECGAGLSQGVTS